MRSTVLRSVGAGLVAAGFVIACSSSDGGGNGTTTGDDGGIIPGADGSTSNPGADASEPKIACKTEAAARIRS